MTAPDESDTPKAAGKVLHVGELTVNGEMLTGYFVQATVEEIRALKTVPIYQRVVLVPVRELASRAAQADAIAKALVKLPGICAAWADALEAKGLTDSAHSVKLAGREARDLLRAYADALNPQTNEKA